MNLYLDIETIPTQDPETKVMLTADVGASRDDLLACLKAPGNYKDPVKIAEYIAAETAKIHAGFDAEVRDAIEKTSFDGGAGQIVCIGWAIEDEEPQSLRPMDLSAHAEGDMLSLWFSTMQAMFYGGTRPVVVGHNHIAFDLPFIWKRAIVHRARPPFWFPRDVKPWSDTVFDTMTQWYGPGARAGGSMEKLCRALGLDGKGDISGADVWPMVQAGRTDEVCTYCRGDVSRTREIYKRLTFA